MFNGRRQIVRKAREEAREEAWAACVTRGMFSRKIADNKEEDDEEEKAWAAGVSRDMFPQLGDDEEEEAVA
jgi:hypothetical protein